MLSQDLITEIMRLEATQNDYLPNADIADKLQDKTLVLLVGASCVGKSTVMEKVVELDDRFGITGSFTTREPRHDGGSKTYTYIPHTDDGLQELFRRIHRHEIVQYAVHPTTKHFYGSELAHYPKQYNLLDMLATNVAGMRRLPFHACKTVGLVVEPSQWSYWFDIRFPEGHPDRHKRRDEAILSFRWLLGQPPDAITWIINGPGLLDTAAKEVIQVGLGEHHQSFKGRKLAELSLAATYGIR